MKAILGGPAACKRLLVGVVLLCASGVAGQDRWPEFEIPPGLENTPPTGLQARFRKIRDSYISINENVGAADAAAALMSEVLVDTLSPDELRAFSRVMHVLIDAGVIDVNENAMTPAQLALIRGQLKGLGSDPQKEVDTGAGSTKRRLSFIRTALQDNHAADESTRYSTTAGSDACECPCAASSSIPPTPDTLRSATPHDDECEGTVGGCGHKSVALLGEGLQTVRCMRAVGLALRRAAVVESAALFLRDNVVSYQHYKQLSDQQQQELKRKFAAELLLSARHYGLTGKDMQAYISKLGVDLPDLQTTSKADLEHLATGWVANSTFEHIAVTTGMNITTQALMSLRDVAGEKLLQRIGVQPTPEMVAAYQELKREVAHLDAMRTSGAQTAGGLNATVAAANAAAAADRIAKVLEGVDVTKVLEQTTNALVALEVVYNTTNGTRPMSLDDIEPWRVVLAFSEADAAIHRAAGRRTFEVQLRNDSVLTGLLLMNATAPDASPVLRDINMTAVAMIAADGSLDAGELKAIVERLEVLSQVYDTQDIVDLMQQVEANYAAINGLPPPQPHHATDGVGLQDLYSAIRNAEREQDANAIRPVYPANTAKEQIEVQAVDDAAASPH